MEPVHPAEPVRNLLRGFTAFKLLQKIEETIGNRFLDNLSIGRTQFLTESSFEVPALFPDLDQHDLTLPGCVFLRGRFARAISSPTFLLKVGVPNGAISLQYIHSRADLSMLITFSRSALSRLPFEAWGAIPLPVRPLGGGAGHAQAAEPSAALRPQECPPSSIDMLFATPTRVSWFVRRRR
jgi:hypothetical protein